MATPGIQQSLSEGIETGPERVDQNFAGETSELWEESRETEQTGDIEEVMENPEVEEQRESTKGRILTVLAISLNLIRGKYSFKDTLKAWREGGSEGVRKYLVEGRLPESFKEESEESAHTAETEEDIESQDTAKEKEPAEIATSEEEEEPAQPEEDEEIPEEAEEEVVKDRTAEGSELEHQPEEMKDVEDVLRRFTNLTEEVFGSYQKPYKEIMSHLDPETISEKTANQYVEIVNRAVALHRATVNQVKRMLQKRQDEIVQIFKDVYEDSTLKEIIEEKKGSVDNVNIGLFMTVSYDEEKETAYLKYAKTEELYAIFYAGVDRSLRDQWYEDKFLLNRLEGRETGKAVAEFGAYMTPGLGTYMDYKDMRKHIERGNTREAWKSGAFMVVGGVSDALLALGGGGYLLRAGVGGARGARAATGAARASRTTRTAGAASRGGRALKEVEGGRKIIENITRLNQMLATKKVTFGLLGASIGVGATSGIVSYFDVTPSGEFHPDEEIEFEKVGDGVMPNFPLVKKLDHVMAEAENQTEEIKRGAIDHLIAETGWDHIKYEIMDENRIRIFRDDYEESTIIRMESNGYWEIEGLGMEDEQKFTDLYQAVSVANLINNLKHLVKTNEYTTEAENPFTFAEEGDLTFDTETGHSPVIMAATCAWTHYYISEIGLNPSQISKIFNKWHKNYSNET